MSTRGAGTGDWARRAEKFKTSFACSPSSEAPGWARVCRCDRELVVATMDGDTVSAHGSPRRCTRQFARQRTRLALRQTLTFLWLGLGAASDTPEPPTTTPSPDDVGTASAEEVPQSGLAERRSSSADVISYTGPGSRPIAKVVLRRRMSTSGLWAAWTCTRPSRGTARVTCTTASSSNTEVIVTVSDLRWSVFRRFSEFEAFHKGSHCSSCPR